mmetsp:Transcript_7685/g.8692  ORF Transcript_7685/g.8692 Transcript_7685/m.8692 type:complete len:87 (+) Transcript_7685:52-312(+)
MRYIHQSIRSFQGQAHEINSGLNPITDTPVAAGEGSDSSSMMSFILLFLILGFSYQLYQRSNRRDNEANCNQNRFFDGNNDAHGIN